MKQTGSFPPLQWLRQLGFNIVIAANKSVVSTLPNSNITLLWVPLGESIPAAQHPFRFVIHEDIWRCHTRAVQTRINALLGVNKRIHARNCAIVRIDKNTAETFLNQYHTGGYVTGYYKYGLYFQGELMACATFSKKRKFNRPNSQYLSAELLRFAVKDGFYVAGGLHKLIANFIKETQINHLMTYADKEWTDGSSYLKIGFVHSGETQPLSFCINPATFERTLKKESCPAHCIEVQNLGNIRFVITK